MLLIFVFNVMHLMYLMFGILACHIPPFLHNNFTLGTNKETLNLEDKNVHTCTSLHFPFYVPLHVLCLVRE